MYTYIISALLFGFIGFGVGKIIVKAHQIDKKNKEEKKDKE